jgi:outer membrane protein OmpA-like peptidoglycan-associated protein
MSSMAPLQARAEAPKQMPVVRRDPEVTGRGLDSTGRLDTAPPIVNEVLSTSGKALDPADRKAMGARLNHDFSKVRVHDDSRAAASAKAVDATAYTVGSHVVFDDGKYEPRSMQGQQLLAHELAHTLQQSDGRPRGETLALGDPADSRERQAEGMAARGIAQQPAAADSARPQRVQRQMNPAAKSNVDLAESASPFLAGAIGSVTVDGFDTGKAEISKANQSALERTARTIQTLLRKYAGSSVHVIGHTDAVGKEENNQTLGQARADSVQAALVAMGIPAEAIMTESKGETTLLVKTQKAEARNRRVEVRFEPKSIPSLSGGAGRGPTSSSFGGGSAVEPSTRSPGAKPDTPSGSATPARPPAKQVTPQVGEIKELTELIKKTADAVKKDPLVRQLREKLAALPMMPDKKEMDKAIDALVKAGSDAGIMAILQAITGRSPSPVTDQQREQTGPAVSQVPTTMLPALKIPINDIPKTHPSSSFHYSNGPQASYAQGAKIRFTLIPPSGFLTRPGTKQVAIVGENDGNVRNPHVFASVALDSAGPTSIEMTAPTVVGNYQFVVLIGLDPDTSSRQEFEVKDPKKKEGIGQGAQNLFTVIDARDARVPPKSHGNGA